MKTRVFLVIFLLLASFVGAEKIGGINMPDKLKTDSGSLVLNGAGVRVKFWNDVYVGGLYLKEKSKSAKQIIDSDESMAIRLHITSPLITSERMEKATRNGFKKSTNDNMGPFEDEIDQFLAVFKDEKIKTNDVFNIVYQPDKGIMVYKNDDLKSTTPGLAFKKILFGIWLSDNPVDKSLKDAMLGN